MKMTGVILCDARACPNERGAPRVSARMEPMKMIRPICAAVFLLAAAAPLHAQVRDTTRTDTTVFVIPGIRIEAARPVLTIGGASAIVVVVDSLNVPAAPSLDAVLREVPAVHVRTNSRGESEISVRGSESRQVAVLLDGVPLTLGWDARTDVSVVPATAPQEISVVRGLSSILYGPNVLGGIVEMSVGQGSRFPDAASVSFATGIDHVGAWGASGTVTSPFTTDNGRWLVRAGAGFRDSPGVPLPDGVTEPVVVDDGLRLNTDVRSADGFMALRYRGDGGGWFSLSSSGFSAERGIAAELGTRDPRLWRYPSVRRLVAVASGGTGDRATPLGRGDLEASFGMDVGRTDIDAYATRDYDDVVGYEDGDDRTMTLRLLGDHTLGRRGDLRAAFTYADINHDADIDGDLAEYRQRLLSLGGETVWRLVQNGTGTVDGLRLSIGAAVDAGDTPETGGREPLESITDWGARTGLTASLGGGDLLVHAGASRRGRFPSLRELYSEALDRFEPNPGLVPEHLVAFEGGITTRLGEGELQAVAFHHRLSDAIRRISLPNGKRQRVNSDQVRSTGVELLLSQAFGPVTLGGDLTFQSVDLIDQADPDARPENLPEIFGSAHARFPVIAGFNAHADARYTGSQFCLDPDSGEDSELDAGTVLGAGVSRVFGLSARSGIFNRLEARVGVDNLTDNALYDQCGLPEPGRVWRFQLRVF